MYVIEREINGRKHFYAGYISEHSPRAFSDSGVQWNATMTSYTKFEESVADQIIKQLLCMGIADVTKRMVMEKRRKGGG